MRALQEPIDKKGGSTIRSDDESLNKKGEKKEGNLESDLAQDVLGNRTDGLNQIEQRAAIHKLQNNPNLPLLIEGAIEVDDGGMRRFVESAQFPHHFLAVRFLVYQ